jgi:hypothetical protein
MVPTRDRNMSDGFTATVLQIQKRVISVHLLVKCCVFK